MMPWAWPGADPHEHEAGGGGLGGAARLLLDLSCYASVGIVAVYLNHS